MFYLLNVYTYTNDVVNLKTPISHLRQLPKSGPKTTKPILSLTPCELGLPFATNLRVDHRTEILSNIFGHSNMSK